MRRTDVIEVSPLSASGAAPASEAPPASGESSTSRRAFSASSPTRSVLRVTEAAYVSVYRAS